MDHEPAKTLADVLVGLTPVFVGGLIAITGTFSGALLTYYLNKKEKQRVLKREKLEQLLLASNRVEKWLDDYRDSKFLKEKNELGINPIEEVKYLSALYFRELHNEVVKLSLASSKYFSLIAECHVEQLKTGNVPQKFLENYKSINAHLLEANSSLLNEASKLAEKL